MSEVLAAVTMLEEWRKGDPKRSYFLMSPNGVEGSPYEVRLGPRPA